MVVSSTNIHNKNLVVWGSRGRCFYQLQLDTLVDVFPIELGDIPASYVSLPTGTKKDTSWEPFW